MSGWHEGPLMAFDTESTGVDAHTCRIVQIGLARIVPGEGAQQHLWLLDPGIDIPDEAAAVHGLTTEHCRNNGQRPAEVLKQVGQAISEWLAQGLPLVAFNASNDCTLLETELARHGLPGANTAGGPVIDPFVLDKHLSKRRGSRKLVDQCAHYDVRIDGAHDAGHDALAAARVAWRIGQRHPDIAAMPLDQLHIAQQTWAREQADSLRAYFDRVGKEHDGVDGTWPVRRAPQAAAA